MLIIYVLDEQGGIDRCFSPYMEAALKGPDVVFGLISHDLKRLQIGKAYRIMFIADGARWIWIRVTELISGFNLAQSCVHELTDCYHAVEHLGGAFP